MSAVSAAVDFQPTAARALIGGRWRDPTRIVGIHDPYRGGTVGSAPVSSVAEVEDREVFLRELLSNASDALNRLRFEMVTNQDVLDPAAELAIRIQADKEARLLTIQDTGIGMTRDEIIENLGTIAQSGARKFLEAAKDKQADLSQVIGQFGVGFYSVFMVAEWVRVTSRSYRPRAKAVSWYATGEDN